MARSIPTSLAPVVEALELEQPLVVTSRQLADIVAATSVETPAAVVIQRLHDRGWLAKTGVRGAWEFIPGAHAGPYPHGDPFLVLRAQFAVTPDLAARVALGSALWLHELSDRAPDQHELSLPPNHTAPTAIKTAFRVVRFEPRSPAVTKHRLPVQAPATILTHLADAPGDVRSWNDVLEALPDLVRMTSRDDLTNEARCRPHATRVRLAYLLETIAPDLVRALDVSAGSKVWFGPRRSLRRHNARWNIADTVLPYPPDEFGQRR